MEVVDLSRDETELEMINGISAVSPVARAPRLASASASAVINLVDSDDEQYYNPRHRRNRKRQRTGGSVNSILDVKQAAKPRVSDEIQVCQVKEAPKISLHKVKKAPQTPLEQVFDVFPDVRYIHAQKLLFEQRGNVDMVLSILLEKGYPRRKESTANSAAPDSSSLTLKSNRNLQPKIDFFSTSSFEPGKKYAQEALDLLQFEFPFLRLDSLKSWLKVQKGHYSPVRRQVEDALAGKEPKKRVQKEEEFRQYVLLTQAKATRSLGPKQKRRIGSQHVTKNVRRSRKKPAIVDSILQEEVKHYDAQFKDWADSVEACRSRSEARKQSQVTGTALECSCCFDQVAIEEMVACKDEGHLFCIDCIKGYAENQIFGNGSLGTNKVTKQPATALLCCDSSGCQSPFPDEHLKKALPKKTLEKYNELQFRAVMEQAGLSQSLCTCPKCGFQADVPATQMIFHCPIEDCKFASCRICGKASHIPFKCEEVVKRKREDDGRLKIEEAISQAKIRTCPNCHTSFIKSDGCNKMTCRCGLKMCYICRQPLPKSDPYSHFCQIPHCDHKSCGKCTLYSNDKEDDERAMREAGIDAAEAFRQKLLKENDNVDIQLDVDKILRGKSSAKSTRTSHRKRRR